MHKVHILYASVHIASNHADNAILLGFQGSKSQETPPVAKKPQLNKEGKAAEMNTQNMGEDMTGEEVDLDELYAKPIKKKKLPSGTSPEVILMDNPI